MNIPFPALTFSKDGLFWPVRDRNPLTQASEQRIRRGDFDGMRIVDARGRLYAVTGLKQLGYAPPFWGFRLFTSRLKRIELDLRDEGQLDIDQIRDRVWRGIQKQREFWESAWDLEELKQEIQCCNSVPAIADLLLKMGRSQGDVGVRHGKARRTSG